MTPTLDIFSTIGILGVLQGIFLGFVVLTQKRKKRTSNFFLALLIFVITLILVRGVLVFSKYIFLVPQLIGSFNSLPFLAGVFLYFHILTFSNKNFKFSKRDLLHFIPFILCNVYYLDFYSQSIEYKLDVLTKIYDNEMPGDYPYLMFSAFTHTFIYCILSLKLLKVYRKNIQEVYSTIDKINLNWMRNLIWSIIILICMVLVMQLVREDSSIPFIYSIYLVIIVYAFGYFFLRQPEIFLDYIERFPRQQNTKYEKSGLSKVKAESLKEKLIDLMENEKLFTDNELTAKTLADRLSITQHNLSQLINENFNQTFFDFVNFYRVEEAKKLLVSPEAQNFTVIAIGLDVGFNSKSTFNSVFKKFTKQTPSEYRLTGKVA